MFCPKCGSEYLEGYSQCADCKVALVPDPPEAELKSSKKVKKTIDSLTTIAKFDLAFDAERAKSVLESEGIRSFVLDGNLIGLNQTLTWAAGGVRLQVSSKDAVQAEKILLDSGFKSLTDDRHFARCPSCNSRNIEREGLSRLEMVLAVLFLGALLLFLRRDFTCLDCGHTWSS
jgi:hypothetical protein